MNDEEHDETDQDEPDQTEANDTPKKRDVRKQLKESRPAFGKGYLPPSARGGRGEK